MNTYHLPGYPVYVFEIVIIICQCNVYYITSNVLRYIPLTLRILSISTLQELKNILTADPERVN